MNLYYLIWFLIAINNTSLGFSFDSFDDIESKAWDNIEAQIKLNKQKAQKWLKKIYSDRESFKNEIMQFLKVSNHYKSALLFAVSQGMPTESGIIMINCVNLFAKEKDLLISRLINLAKIRLDYLLEKSNLLNDSLEFKHVVHRCRLLLRYLNNLNLLNEHLSKYLNLPDTLKYIILFYANDESGSMANNSCVIS